MAILQVDASGMPLETFLKDKRRNISAIAVPNEIAKIPSD